jgi:hypothetical protein
MRAAADALPPCRSFMHLHVGFDATGAFGLVCCLLLGF